MGVLHAVDVLEAERVAVLTLDLYDVLRVREEVLLHHLTQRLAFSDLVELNKRDADVLR